MLTSKLTGIKLFNYRNFKQKNLFFSEKHSLLKGKNAVGKTSILEAISFLSPGNGFKKDLLENIINHNSIKEGASINLFFHDEGVDQNLKIIFQSIELKLYKNYFLNDKKISQQELMKIFQLFWFSELDKVYFIKDKQYQRNSCNRIMCYFDSELFKLLNHYAKLRREKKKIFFSTQDRSWLESIDKQLFPIVKSIMNIKYDFMNQFNLFVLEYPNSFFIYQLNYDFNNLAIDDFLTKFKLEMNKENESKGEVPLNSLYDPAKSVFSLFHENIPLNQLSSAQSKLLILSFFLDIATFLKLRKNKITIFLIDEIFDNFDMINLQKVIEHCAKNNFQSFFSSTDNFTIKDEIKDIEVIDII